VPSSGEFVALLQGVGDQVAGHPFDTLIPPRASIASAIEWMECDSGHPAPETYVGGSVWESNPPEPPKAPPSGFEGHRRKLPGSPSLGNTGGSGLYVSLPVPTYPRVLSPICHRGAV